MIRDQQDHDPGAVEELAFDDDQERDQGGERAEAVDRGFRAPAGTAAPQPQPHHAGLRQEEGEEHAHRIERDQAVGAAAEYNK